MEDINKIMIASRPSSYLIDNWNVQPVDRCEETVGDIFISHSCREVDEAVLLMSEKQFNLYAITRNIVGEGSDLHGDHNGRIRHYLAQHRDCVPRPPECPAYGDYLVTPAYRVGMICFTGRYPNESPWKYVNDLAIVKHLVALGQYQPDAEASYLGRYGNLPVLQHIWHLLHDKQLVLKEAIGSAQWETVEWIREQGVEIDNLSLLIDALPELSEGLRYAVEVLGLQVTEEDVQRLAALTSSVNGMMRLDYREQHQQAIELLTGYMK